MLQTTLDGLVIDLAALKQVTTAKEDTIAELNAKIADQDAEKATKTTEIANKKADKTAKETDLQSKFQNILDLIGQSRSKSPKP